MPLPTHLLIVTVQVHPSIEQAWNDWYDTTHLPAALACPGVLAGRRYATAAPTVVNDHAKRSTADTKTYVTVYELASPEAVNTPEFTAMRGWAHFAPHVHSTTQVLAARA